MSTFTSYIKYNEIRFKRRTGLLGYSSDEIWIQCSTAARGAYKDRIQMIEHINNDNKCWVNSCGKSQMFKTSYKTRLQRDDWLKDWVHWPKLMWERQRKKPRCSHLLRIHKHSENIRRVPWPMSRRFQNILWDLTKKSFGHAKSTFNVFK